MTEQPAGESLYRKEPKIYPRQVKGRFARLRVAAVWVLLGLFYLLPWIQVGGKQSMLFDLPARKFYIFGLTFWPQDFVYLALLLITAGLSLPSISKTPSRTTRTPSSFFSALAMDWRRRTRESTGTIDVKRKRSRP